MKVLNVLWAFLDFLWNSFLLLAPMLMLGLFLCGLIHVFISRRAVLRFFQEDSIKSVSTSAALGVPIPLCSCSVVPVVTEMRRKGASRSASMSFLITAPETGADSILVTNAFFGPVVAVIRPVISFFTAVFCGIFCIGLLRDPDESKSDTHDNDSTDVHGHESEHSDEDGHDHSHDHGHDHDHGHKPLFETQDDCYVSFAQLKRMFSGYVSKTIAFASSIRYASWLKPDFYLERKQTPDTQAESTTSDEPETQSEDQSIDLPTLIKHIFRYGFVEVADDILFALLVGIFLGGILYLAIPSDLMANEYARWLAYPIVVLVGIPLYICASASTPIAAAMVAKGVSPGAALVFLMTGPATNTGTIAIVARQFGAKFASIYVLGVIVATVFFGVVLDLLLLAVGWQVAVNLEASDTPAILVIQWTGALSLIALIVWRFRAGALKSGWEDLWINLRPLYTRFGLFWEKLTRGKRFVGLLIPNNPGGIAAWSIVILLFVSSGFSIIPPGHQGFGVALGKVRWHNLEPGLHYLAPAPFVRVDKWPVRQIVSLNTDVLNEYVSGDINLIELSFNIQYQIKDPYVYYYQALDPQTTIRAFVESHVRTYISAKQLEPLLNKNRAALEQHINTVLTSDHDVGNPVVASIQFIKANLLRIGPVTETVEAFRDVSSAQEDKERIIVNAQRFLVSLTPQAFGNAEYEVQQAKGLAARREKLARAEAQAVSSVAEATRTAPDVLWTMLWREKLENALAGNPKIIVPNQESLDRVSLWKRKENVPAKNTTENKE